MKGLKQYAIGVASTVGALILTLAISPARAKAPYLLLSVGVMLAASQGLGPGLLGTALGAVFGLYFLIPPSNAFSISGPEDLVPLSLFAIVGSAITWIFHRYRLSMNKAVEAGEELRRDRQWLRITLSSIGDAVLATGADGRITFLNPVASRLTGWTEELALGRPAGEVFRIINEETREAAEDIIGRVLRERCVVSLANHTALLSRDGREIPIEDSAAPILDGAGDLIGVVLVFHDVTEKRRAQEALKLSQAQFRTLADAIPQLAWMARPDGHIFWYNQRWYEYTGATPEEMEGWGWQSVHDPEYLPKVLERWKASIAEGRVFDMTFPLRGSDGVFRPFLTRVMPVRDENGAITGWFGTNTDVTEQREREEALERASEQRRLALEAGGLGAWDYRLDTGDVFWDETCRKMWGPVGSRIDYEDAISQIHPDDQAAVVDALQRAQRGENNGTYDCEFRVMWPDGTMRWLASHGRTFFEGGVAVRMVGVNLDITERRRAEERLRETQKFESVALLAGGIAHDFNNLLIGVVGSASLGREMAPPGSPIHELFGTILKTGDQLAHLTRQMLAYSGKGRFIVEPLNLSEVIPELSTLLQASLSKKIELHLELEREAPYIEADRGQVQQVFMNLVMNAAEAIGSESGSITIKTGVREIAREPDLCPGRYVFLEVRDTGCGIDEATKAKIFEPFFSTKFVGRGLGLAAAAGIMRGHKGAITVASAPGQGSCFTVLFPASAVAPAPAPAMAAESRALKGTGTVLVVDDEEVVREMAKTSLERYGYRVLLAADGVTAIDLFKRHPSEIALVVLDLSMPGMGGQEALPELRKIRQDTKVVVSSGYTEKETMKLFSGQKVSGFLQKPYTLKRLAEKVRTVLSEN